MKDTAFMSYFAD